MGFYDMQVKHTIDCNHCHPRHLSIFCQLPDKQLQFLNNYKATKTFRKHEIIFSEGDAPRGLYCIFSGLVKIYKMSSDGKEQIVRLAAGSDVLGYRAFFSGEEYTASAQVIEEATVCFIEKGAMEKVIEVAPDLVHSLLKRACTELREAEERFQSFVEESVEERLAHFLSLFWNRAKKTEFVLSLSREEIASLIGARPETVIRIFSHWKKKGYIKVRARSLAILNPSFLSLN